MAPDDDDLDLDGLDDDGRVYLCLGVAMGEAQLLELALVKLVEGQNYDVDLPLEGERWAEISKWLYMSAGDLRRLLHVPDLVAKDVQAAVGRRNRVAHDTWKGYCVAKDRRAAAADWVPWLVGEAKMFGQVQRGLIHLRDHVQEVRADGASVEDADLERVWREHVPEPIAPRPDR